MAPTFTPKAGTVQEWITSLADTSTRTWVFIGKIVRLSTSNKREPDLSRSFDGII